MKICCTLIKDFGIEDEVNYLSHLTRFFVFLLKVSTSIHRLQTPFKIMGLGMSRHLKFSICLVENKLTFSKHISENTAPPTFCR